jgi:pyruvate formate lyase activating enzyme
VAYTYNDPVIFLEYAVDVAQACRAAGVRSVAVTAGYVCAEPRAELFGAMDAANVDLKGFTEDFYHRLCSGHLAPVLETIEYLVHETDVWVELTTLLIPGYNDDDDQLEKLTGWVAERLGPDVPLHFSRFHPDYKMLDVPPTTMASLEHARDIALRHGLRYVYTGNVHDEAGDTTRCPSCGTPVVVRDWYEIRRYALTDDGHCASCGAVVAGVFDGPVGTWGARRRPVRLSDPVVASAWEVSP